ncbi:MAG: protoporphyrinogen oxidase [Haloarculaceae archaeon]
MSDADADAADAGAGAAGANDADVAVAIVGAGITGLALTHELAERGVSSLAFEAEATPGGVIESRPLEGGLVAERGPNRFTLTEKVEELIDVAGLREETITPPEDLPMYVYAGGRLREAPFDLSTFLRTDLLSWFQKLRVLGEPVADDVRPEESVGQAVRRLFGTGFYENFVEPIYGGTYGSNPDRMPVRHAMPFLLGMQSTYPTLLWPVLKRAVSGGDRAAPVSFEGGVQRLPAALAERYADRVRLETPVTAIEREGDGYRVETDEETVTAGHVVLTVPAWVAADLLADVDPDSADALGELTYNPLAIVTMESDARREGYGYQVKRAEPLRTLGVSWHHSLFGRPGQYTAFLGGMDDPEIVAADPEHIGEVAVRDFETVMQATATVRDVARFERAIPAHDDSWAALDRVDLPEGLTLATNYTARVGVPGRVREAESLADELA